MLMKGDAEVGDEGDEEEKIRVPFRNQEKVGLLADGS